MLFLIVPTSVQGQQFGGAWDKTFVPTFITLEMASITFWGPKLMLLGNCIKVSRFALSA